MKYGKVSGELIKLRDEIAGCDVVQSRAARKRDIHAGNDVKIDQDFVAGCRTDSEYASPFPANGGILPEICWKSVARPGKLGKKWSAFMAARLPDLGRWTVRIGRSEKYDIHAEIPIPSRPREPRVPSSEPEMPAALLRPDEEQRAAEPESKIAPGKPKRSSRAVNREATPPVISEPPKPLKVIRRRGEQAEKVFETPPKTFPQAMLEGIRYRPDEDPDT